MSSRNVEEDTLNRLDKFISGGGVLPECPFKPGEVPKVNVAGLCRELGLKVADAQHFFKKDSLKTAVNALAERQGLQAIGIRAAQKTANEVTQVSIARTATQSGKDAQALLDAKAQYATLLKELEKSKPDLEVLRLENASLREQLNLIHEGLFPRIQ